TAEWLDMFWALNGATSTRRRTSARHSALVSVDLPAPLVVPTTISAPVVASRHSVVDATSRADPLLEGMLHLDHLGHGVGDVDHGLGRLARGEEDADVLRA